MDAPISVFVVDDHAIVREGLRVIIDHEPDMTVLGDAGDAVDALEQIALLEPSVALVDQRMAPMSGVELCREIVSRKLPTAVVILSAALDDGTVREAMRAGAIGYVVKDVEAGALTDAIRSASRGQVALDGAIQAPSGCHRGI